jgi:lipopolysaccharide transport system ATP-binding protein
MASAIKVENLSKIYRLGEIGTGTISRDLERFFKMKILKQEDPYLIIGEANDRATKGASDIVYSLNDINFEIKQGDAIGIIGRNGAGKSTLLKILSRVTSPTTGKINIKGRVASLLEVGTGFHPELTGRENIYLNGAILGMRKKEIDKKFDEIVDFSGVERYIDTPVKRYSSGMYVRLAFAVAAHLESEILIVDEVLAVGDAEFQKKCIGKMEDISVGDGRSILFVSHNMSAIAQLCGRGILMNKGRIEVDSDINSAINQYLSIDTSQSFFISDKTLTTNKDAYFTEIRIQSSNGKDKSNFLVNEPINVSFKININRNKDKYTLFCMIVNQTMNRVFAAESDILEDTMTLRINPEFLVRGKYSIHAFIHIPRNKQEDVVENVCHFEIIDNFSNLSKHDGYDYGSVFGNYEWLK